jgi:hypothetical protein
MPRRQSSTPNEPQSPYRAPRVSRLKAPSLRQLRRYAIARSLFKATSLPRAIARLGFVQADPMRAPARAQDLILAQRVKDYRAGELERRYPRLAIEEAFFVNYGFVPHETVALLYPREAPRSWDARMRARAQDVLAFVRQHGRTRPCTCRPISTMAASSAGVATRMPARTCWRPALQRAAARGAREAGARVYQTIEQEPQDDAPRPGLRGPASCWTGLCSSTRRRLRPAWATVPTAARWSAAPGRRGAFGPGARQVPPPMPRSTACCGSGRRARIPCPPAHGGRQAAHPRALRPRGLGPTAVPVVLGLGIQARGLCAGPRAAWAITRCRCYGASNAGLGQSEGG